MNESFVIDAAREYVECFHVVRNNGALDTIKAGADYRALEDAKWRLVDLVGRVNAALDEGVREGSDAEIVGLRERIAALESLARFGAKALSVYQNEGARGDLDGGVVQAWAVDAGAMENILRCVPCGAQCACQDYYYEGEEAECYPINNWPLVQSLAAEVDAVSAMRERAP